MLVMFVGWWWWWWVKNVSLCGGAGLEGLVSLSSQDPVSGDESLLFTFCGEMSARVVHYNLIVLNGSSV